MSPEALADQLATLHGTYQWETELQDAIEVKTKGSRAEVVRQLDRYAAHDQVTGLLLVTSLAKLRVMPSTLRGKPVSVLWIRPF